MTELRLRELAGGGEVRATSTHLEIRLPHPSSGSGGLSEVHEDLLRLDLEALTEQGVLAPVTGGYRAEWEDAVDAFDEGIGQGVLEVGDPNPYLLHVGSTAALGLPDFAFTIAWKAGLRTIDAEHAGMFLWVPALERLVRLDTHTARVLLIIDRFNALPREARSQEEMLRSLAQVQDESGKAVAFLSDALRGTRVIVPDQLGLSMEIDDDGRLTFVPLCAGVDPLRLRNSFMATRGRRPIYSFKDDDGVDVRIAFGPRQLDVLERMMAVRRIAGEEAEQLRVHPEAAFDGLLDVLDLAFWERVTGIGEPPRASVPGQGESETGFLDRPVAEHAGAVDRKDGEPADNDPRTTTSEHAPRSGSYLIVETNEDSPFVPRAASSSTPVEVDVPDDHALPSALTGVPKAHQREAIAWLKRSRRIGRRGVLLADDMGLGKTFQVLAELSSLIERTGLDQRVDPRTGRLHWRPILIVAPLILLDAETWQNDIRRFFAHDGEQFLPLLVLHGPGIEAARQHSGQDVRIGRAALDADFLSAHRVVLTNYETVVNYQLSLAQLRDGRSLWSTIVTDEAQEYKVPNTRISHALKAMDADFFVASTGTPVENRLLDLWNIVDTITPSLLGTANTFSARYERATGDDGQRKALEELKRLLKLGERDAHILRRTKEQILTADLPEKRIRKLYAEMTPQEVSAHLGLLHGVRRTGASKGQHLRTLQALVRSYQHPLGEAVRTASVPELLGTSAKLRVVVDTLREIRRAGEKVLIFARLRDIQTMLARVVEAEFGVHVPIINGATSSGRGRIGSSMATERARESRRGILKEFEEAEGFRVCVLSPFVAGTGLTITAANHVIHYGRWWNPAVEAQATDRAYRIGQERRVTVYLPILRDATGELPRSFDELLDAHLERKQSLADFLMPQSSEESSTAELMDELLEGTQASAPPPAMTLADVRGLGHQHFEALVATLFGRDGYNVCLTPTAGDGGADVLASKGAALLLVQAKFSQTQAPVSESALMDLVAAQDLYGNVVRASALSLILVANTRISEAARATATRDGIEYRDTAWISEELQKHAVTMSELVAWEARRCRSIAEVMEWIRLAGLQR